MSTWTYLVHSSATGEPLGQLPLGGVAIEDVLSGRSTLNGSLSTYDAQATRELTAPWLCELTVVRDLDVSGGSVIAFHGPIVGRIPDTRTGRVQISAASPHVYFYKRFTEALHQYDRDTFDLVRDLIDVAMAKTGGSLYRLGYTETDSGVDTALTVGGIDRRRVSDLIEMLAEDEVYGFDFRWDATWHDLEQRLVQRTLTMGYPTIGADRSLSRVIEVTPDLIGVTDSEDGLSAANRLHGLGAASSTSRLRSVANSGSSLTAGYPLLEDVVDLSDIKDQALLDGITEHMLALRLPGSRSFTTSHTSGDHLPFGALDLGDTVTVRLTAGVEPIDLTPRVVGITTTPATDSFTLTHFLPEAS